MRSEAINPELVAAHVSEPAATTVHGLPPRRLWATTVAMLALVGVVIGGLALARRASRFGTASGRLGATVALVTGSIVAPWTLASYAHLARMDVFSAKSRASSFKFSTQCFATANMDVVHEDQGRGTRTVRSKIFGTNKPNESKYSSEANISYQEKTDD